MVQARGLPVHLEEEEDLEKVLVKFDRWAVSCPVGGVREWGWSGSGANVMQGVPPRPATQFKAYAHRPPWALKDHGPPRCPASQTATNRAVEVHAASRLMETGGQILPLSEGMLHQLCKSGGGLGLVT